MKTWFFLFLIILSGCKPHTAYNNPSYHILFEDELPFQAQEDKENL